MKKEKNLILDYKKFNFIYQSLYSFLFIHLKVNLNAVIQNKTIAGTNIIIRKNSNIVLLYFYNHRQYISCFPTNYLQIQIRFYENLKRRSR